MSLWIDLLFCVILFGMTASVGKNILKYFKFSFSTDLQEFLIGLGLGTVLFMFTVLVMGFFGWIRTVPAGALLLLGFIFSIKDLIRWIRKILSIRLADRFFKTDLFLKFVIVISLFTAASNLIRANTPPITDDELSYHLYGPKWYIKTGYWKPPPVDHYPNYYPQSMEMIYTVGMLFRRDLTPAMIHFSYGMLSLLALFLISCRIMDIRGALLACVIFSTMPRFTSLIHIAYTDFIVLYLSLAAFECYFQWTETRLRMWIFLCGILMSAALASKLSVPPIALSFFILYCIDAWKLKEFDWKKNLTLWIFVGFCALLFLSPWLIRNHLYKSNLFYPFSPFGLPGDEIMHHLTAALHEPPLVKLKKVFQLPHGILTYDFSQGTGPLFMIWPLIFLFGFRSLNETAKRIIIFSLLHILTTLWILHPVGFNRYILMSHALLSIIASYVFFQLLFYLTPVWNRILKILFIVPMLMPNFAFAAGGAFKRLPYSTGKISREEYLNKFYDQEGYDTILFCNQNLSQKDDIIFFIYGDCSRPYYYDVNLHFCNSMQIMNSRDFETIKPYLDHNGITHILFIKYFGWQKNSDGVWELKSFYRLDWLQDAEKKGLISPIFDNGKAVVYQRVKN